MSQGPKFMAELIGTFGLIFFGAGAVLQQNVTQAVGITGIAVAHGLAILVGIYALGATSGGHFNPCVTFGMAMTRRISWGDAVSYWIAQLAGAAIAAWLLSLAYPTGASDVHLGAPALGASIGPMLGMALEAVMAFLLVLVVFGSSVDPRAPKGFAGLAIGLAYTANMLVGASLTGAAFNPARAFGPALIAGAWQDHWIYWVGPMSGAAVAAVLYDRFFLSRA
ncbi:MAG TPA: MIP family channel protein [Candidatus Eisenbacteria bacterium]|nr:MIP family channel protein [Candidatus Eisenbacteria bacterium]